MMKLKCLRSGSSGNCYILENDAEALIIEAGIPFKEVKISLDFNIRKIVSVIYTHAHKDHSRYLQEYMRAGIHVSSHLDVWENTFKATKWNNAAYMENKQGYGFGGFNVAAFDVEHDVPCCGYLIAHEEIGRLLFVTDTEYIKYRFKNLNHILVECNYSKDYINPGAVNRDHVLTGHMELETCKGFIQANLTQSLRNVCLLHLSDQNGDSARFQREVKEITGNNVNVFVAEKGLEIDLDVNKEG